jgi:hypothetical protein
VDLKMAYSTQSVVIGDSEVNFTVFVTSNTSDFARSTTFFDASGNVVGSKFEQFADETFVADPNAVSDELVFSLQVPVTVDGAVTGYQAISSYRGSTTDPLEESTYNYGVDGDTGGVGALQGGTETLDGVSVTINADGSRQSGVISDSALIALAQTGSAFDALEVPDFFKLDTTSDGTADTVYLKVISDTSSDQGGFKETAYFDANAKIIGQSIEYKDRGSGDSVTKFETVASNTGAVNDLGLVRIGYEQDGTTLSTREIRYESEATGDVSYTDTSGTEQTYTGTYRTEKFENYS